MLEDNLAGELASWWRAFDVGELLDEAVPPTDSDLVVYRHVKYLVISSDRYRGFAITKPSTVPVVAATLSITSFRRSPAAAINETGAVVNSVGVTPAVPPPWTGDRS